MKDSDNLVNDKSFQFALEIISLYKSMVDQRKEYILSKQLLKAGTSVGANIREAQNAESRLDFIHKMHIAQKECAETLYWLELLYVANFITAVEFKGIHEPGQDLLRMIKSIILTTKKNLQINK